MQAFIAQVVSDPVTNFVIVLLVVLPVFDWITGSLRAIANGTFTLAAFDVFVRTQLAGRAVPLILLLLLGRGITVATPSTLVIPGLDLSILTAGGILAAVPFLVRSAKSIVDNVNPNVADVLPTVTETRWTA